MTSDDIIAFAEQFPTEFLKFDRVPAALRLSNRADLCAFLLLDKIVPGTGDMVCGAEHDKIWLTTDLDDLAPHATDEIVLTLIRCGVMFSHEGLSMFT